MTTIVLIGTRSSGKTTLAQALRDAWPGPLQVSGIDTFLACHGEAMFAPPGSPAPSDGFTWVPTVVDGVEAWAVVPGPRGEAAARAAHAYWAACDREGIDQVVDHVLMSESMAHDLRVQLDGPGVLLVGVRCPLDEVERRERERGDRVLGQGRGIGATVHAFTGYDVELDTSVLTPQQAAALVLAAVVRQRQPVD